jgi:hypothetical protein
MPVKGVGTENFPPNPGLHRLFFCLIYSLWAFITALRYEADGRICLAG